MALAANSSAMTGIEILEPGGEVDAQHALRRAGGAAFAAGSR